MRKSFVSRALMSLMLLMAVSAASGADRFYIGAVNMEPGETKTLAFHLENEQAFYGFQADIVLPEGLDILTTANGKADVTLSSRFDNSYSVVSNLLSNGSIRLGTFSTSHAAITEHSGALLYLRVHASEDFVSGTLSVTNILFIGENDKDVQLPDCIIEMGNVHDDRFYIPDFQIEVGETKTIGIVLDNETDFTAFQTDMYLPEGLTVVNNSFVLTARGSSNHTVSVKSFSDGRTRIACFSNDGDVFDGNSGVLLEFQVTAAELGKDCTIELKNQIFSMSNAKEYILPNSTTLVTQETNVLMGDANEDGIVNAMDVSLVIGRYLDNEVNLNFAAADVVEDGFINAQDAAAIRSIFLSPQQRSASKRIIKTNNSYFKLTSKQ